MRMVRAALVMAALATAGPFSLSDPEEEVWEKPRRKKPVTTETKPKEPERDYPITRQQRRAATPLLALCAAALLAREASNGDL